MKNKILILFLTLVVGSIQTPLWSKDSQSNDDLEMEENANEDSDLSEKKDTGDEEHLSENSVLDRNNYPHRGRGKPSEYDPGPPSDSEWLKIFSSLPNYRGIGRAVIKRERFRWHWGPVIYSGRLAPNQVKVLVIGQEGAQVESLSTRTFTGGSGQHMQHFLNWIGINRSYLFLNTFSYCIHGQYRDPKIDAEEGDYWMAQNQNSPIVRHRHRMFNHALNSNDLRLVIAVGSAARDTLVTWIQSRGGICQDKTKVQTCDISVLGEKIKVLAVPHPGGAGQAETDEERTEILEHLRSQFERSANLVADWLAQDPEWLPLDLEATRPNIVQGEDGKWQFDRSFKYRSAPIPYRDFPYGINWRLGKRGTTSNRSDGQRSVKIFSDDGEYADETVKWDTPKGSRKQDSGYLHVRGDLPYEPPRVDYNAFDPGPGEEWAKLLMGEEVGFEWPDFKDLGVTAPISFGIGPMYRGRFSVARVLIVADQESHDDLFTGRALSGDGGQKIQHFLRNIGITDSYVIIRTLPVDTLDLEEKEVRAISTHPQVRRVRGEIIERILSRDRQGSPTKLIITVGVHAKEVFRKIDTDLPVIHLEGACEPKAVENWNKALKTISKLDYEVDVEPAFKPYKKNRFSETRLEINRYDLPFHTRRWMGTSGSLASRALNNSEHYKLTMPLWAAQLKPQKLSKAEIESLTLDGWLSSKDD